MAIFHNRPLALACVCFALTSVLLTNVLLPVRLLLTGLALLLFVILLIFCRKNFTALLCLFFVFLSLLSSTLFFGIQYAHAKKLIGETVEVEGFVLDRDYSTPYSGSFRVHVTAVNGEKRAMDAYLETVYSSSLQVGDGFTLTVTARDFEKDGDYEEELYRLSQGELIALTSNERESGRRVGERQNDPRVLLSKWKTRLSYRLYTAIEGREGAIASALLLGDKSFLTGEDDLHFKRSGTSHLLALSGLHVSILIGVFELLMKKLRIPKLIRSVIIPLLAVGYLMITGFALSTVRAVIMACFLYFAFLGRARYDSFTALCAALVLILFITPYAVWDLSLWMSFLAAASIVVFSPVFYRFLEEKLQMLFLPNWLSRAVRGFLTALFVGVIANLGLLLLIALSFREFSLLSVPVTMLLSPVISILLPISALVLMLPRAAVLCKLLAGIVLCVVDRGAAMKDVLLPVAQPITLVFLSLMTLVLILYAVTRMKVKYAVPAVAIFLALGIGSACLSPILQKQKGISVFCMQTHGGELLFFSHGRETVAVDLSSGVETCAGEFKLAADAVGCNEIDDLILSRYYNRSPYLLSSVSERLTVRRVRLPMPQNELERDIAKRLEQEASLHGIEVLYHVEDLAIEELEVLCAVHTPMERDEASLILLSFAAGDEVMTCLNAAMLEGELGSMARAYLYSSDVLLVTRRAKGTHSFPVPETLDRLIVGDEGLTDRILKLPKSAERVVLLHPYQFFLQ
ncbi:MAG: ComEC/Rec2 family competence protein [Ruminococcaceae bacterium]|nr:ComEC/Rec2 family competence protein [Oscillospiraceae bacterium]